MKKICVVCGEEFYPTTSHQIYCSNICRVKHDREKFLADWHAQHPPQKKNCILCGKEFEAKRSDQKYCSKYCCKKADNANRELRIHKDNTPRLCLVCGKEFIPSRSTDKTCSKECSEIYCSSLRKKIKKSVFISNPVPAPPPKPIVPIKKTEVQFKRILCHDCGKPTNGSYRCNECKQKFYLKNGYRTLPTGD